MQGDGVVVLVLALVLVRQVLVLPLRARDAVLLVQPVLVPAWCALTRF
jgi:hypothetical protein